jgi:protein-disulfide isomerase
MAAGAHALESAPAAPIGGTPEEREISGFIASIPPEARQLLSDTLAAYAASGEYDLPAARTVIGPAAAEPRLRLTEFTDTLCSHCKQLHETLLELRRRFGDAAFTVAPHQYPLDGSCNKNIVRDESEPIRCLAARVQICAEGMPGAFDFVGKLFENQGSLSDDKLWELAEPLGSREDLDACVRSAETEKKLQDDITWAAGHGITGTPFLFIGRRQAIAYPPLLYVLALTRGAPSSPAFVVLPAPQPIPWPTAPPHS